MPRELRVWGESGIFTVKVPDDAKVTFGPWAPPNSRMTEDTKFPSGGKSFGPERGGTLRVYKGSRDNGDVLAVWAGVQGFRDTSLEYSEEPRFPEPEPEPELPKPVIPYAWGEMDDDEKADLAERVAAALSARAVDEAMKPEDDDDDDGTTTAF